MIRLSMMRTFICLILAGAGLAACSGWFQNGQPYALPRAEVHRILAQTGIPPLIFGTIPPKYKIERSDPSNIVWIIKKQDHEALRFVANLTSTSSTSTRVSIELKGPSEGPYRETSRKLVENRSIANLY